MDGRFFVAQTLGRAEKCFASEIEAAGFDYVLPMALRMTRSGGKQRQTLLPVFPNYVAFAGDAIAAPAAAWATRRICNLIPVADQARLRRELAACIEVFGDDGCGGTFADPALLLGRRCRVIDGHSFAHFEGYVDEVRRRACVVIRLTFFGQAQPMQIDPKWLTPVDD